MKRLKCDLRQIRERIQDNDVYSLEVKSYSSVTYFFRDGEIWFVIPCVKE